MRLQIFYDIIKKNVYTIEQKFNHTFNKITLILENFNPTFINLSGYKKLNWSQILKPLNTVFVNFESKENLFIFTDN